MRTGWIVMRRPGGWSDALWSYRVEIDGRQVGRVGSGQAVTLEVPAGVHAVRARHWWDGSPVLTAQIDPGQVLALTVRPRPFRETLRGGSSADRHLKLYRDPVPTETAPASSVQCLQFTGSNHEQVGVFLAGQEMPAPVKPWNWIVKQHDGTVAQHSPEEFLELYDPA